MPYAHAFAVMISVAALPALSSAASSPPALAIPIDCLLGPNCQIQNYADDSLGPAVADFACGARTYDGHKGTDFRIRDQAQMKTGVAVIAAADGVVKAVRDGMDDVSIRGIDAQTVTGRECGNGVVLDHGNQWVTQYCHMRRGSLRVKQGQKLSQGAVLGEVGLSGFTEFAHVHFEVRHGAAIVNPFTGQTLGATKCGSKTATLWSQSSIAHLGYQPAAFLDSGFASAPISIQDVEQAKPPPPNRGSSALVAFVRILGVRAGDIETLTVTSPGKKIMAVKGPIALEKGKAQWISFAGRKRTDPQWQPGIYTARYSLKRSGTMLIDRVFSIDLR